MYFDDDLKKLRTDKKNIKGQIDTLNARKEKEIEDFKNTLAKKYDDIEKQNWTKFNELNGKICNECELIQICSTFNLEEISKILRNLISVYENENYEVKTVSYRINDGDLFNDAKVIINKRNLEIFSKEVKQDQFNRLVKNGIVIPLAKGFSENNFSKEISFYEADSTNVNQKITFRKHVYAKEFIDFVITYRIKNNVNKITLKELEELLAKFVYYNFEKIKKYHEFKDECRRRELESYIEQDKINREKHIKRMLKKYNLK